MAPHTKCIRFHHATYTTILCSASSSIYLGANDVIIVRYRIRFTFQMHIDYSESVRCFVNHIMAHTCIIYRFDFWHFMREPPIYASHFPIDHTRCRNLRCLQRARFSMDFLNLHVCIYRPGTHQISDTIRIYDVHIDTRVRCLLSQTSCVEICPFLMFSNRKISAPCLDIQPYLQNTVVSLLNFDKTA